MQTLNREALAWAAGFFDGEGSVHFNGSSLLLISIQQNDAEVLHRFNEAVLGLGRVNGPYIRATNANEFYCYYCGKFERSQAIIAMLWPFLGSIKRRQASDAMKRYQHVRSSRSS